MQYQRVLKKEKPAQERYCSPGADFLQAMIRVYFLRLFVLVLVAESHRGLVAYLGGAKVLDGTWIYIAGVEEIGRAHV